MYVDVGSLRVFSPLEKECHRRRWCERIAVEAALTKSRHRPVGLDGPCRQRCTGRVCLEHDVLLTPADGCDVRVWYTLSHEGRRGAAPERLAGEVQVWMSRGQVAGQVGQQLRDGQELLAW